jgi:hypothetical protein
MPANAIEERLDRVEEQWFAFTGEAAARVGRWRLDADGIRLVETFLEAQTREGTAVPDFIMRLAVPFTDPLQHGVQLRLLFEEEIRAAAGDMADAQVPTDWMPPPRDQRLDDIGELLSCMHSFKLHYGSIFERVVVVLMPEGVSDAAAWAWWVERLVQRPVPEHLRTMLFDDAAAPLLDAVAAKYPVQCMTLAPELDMTGAIDELVKQVGGSTPADVYRRMFVGMSTAAQKGNIAGSVSLGARAIRVAQQQGWVQQVAVVHMALGSILMGAGRLQEAVAAFRASGTAAEASRDGGDAGSDRVVVQARLAEGAALLQEDAIDHAAAAYDAAGVLAEAQQPQDPMLMLECRRMSGYCHERLGRPDLAWHHLGMALKAAEEIDPSQRLQTTLPYVVRSIVGLTEQPAYQRYRPLLEDRLTRILGPDWHRLVEEKLSA